MYADRRTSRVNARDADELDAGSSAELGESFPQEGPRTSLPRLAVETTLRAFDLR